jgi:colanic acid biosynthesis glycosyl transferase WcaI
VKILYVSQYFPPEMGAPSARAVELARHWVAAGHDVTVLTGFPNHPTGVVPLEWRPRLRRLFYRETASGIDIVRTFLWPLPNRKPHERILNYSSFCVSAAIRGMALERPDVAIATSPQLLVGVSGWWIARLKNVPFVFEVRDLWPESLGAVGVGSERSLLHRSLGAVAKFLYQNSTHIVVVTPAFKEHLIQRWHVPAAKVSIVENGVETELFTPGDPDPELRRLWNLDGKFVVCYVGTMGMAHGLNTLIDAASVFQEQNPKIAFLLVGEGADKERIKSLSQARGLTNIRFIDQQPRELIPAFVRSSDACLVLLKRTELFKTVIPTKMLEFMSCARPIILGVEGQAREILDQARAGIGIEPENVAELVSAITALANDESAGKSMGQKGRAFIIEGCSRAQTAKTYISVLESLLPRS